MNGKGRAGAGAFFAFLILWFGAKYVSWLTEDAILRITSDGPPATVEVRLFGDSAFEVHRVGPEPVVLSVPARRADVTLVVGDGNVRAELELADRKGARPRMVGLDLEAGQEGTLHSETGFLPSRSWLGTGLTGRRVDRLPGESAGEAARGGYTGVVVRAVAVEGARLEALEIAVPADMASVDLGTCSSGPSLPPSSRGQRISMLWGPEEARVRRVSVTLDDDGEVTRFNDVRGALMNIKTRGHPDPGTSVFLDLKERLAIIENQYPTGEVESRKVPFSDALGSDLLGNPHRLMEFVLSHCGGEGKP